MSARADTLRFLRVWLLHPDDPEVQSLHRSRFGYPADMPGLRLLRPPEGSLAGPSAEGCHFARRQRGELAEVY